MMLLERLEAPEERALKVVLLDVEEYAVAFEPEAAHMRVFWILGNEGLRLHGGLELLTDDGQAVLDGAFEHPLHLADLVSRIAQLIGRASCGGRRLRRRRRVHRGHNQSANHHRY